MQFFLSMVCYTIAIAVGYLDRVLIVLGRCWHKRKKASSVHVCMFLRLFVIVCNFPGSTRVNRNELIVVACFRPLYSMAIRSFFIQTPLPPPPPPPHLFGNQFTDKNYWMLKSTYWTKVGLKASTHSYTHTHTHSNTCCSGAQSTIV